MSNHNHVPDLNLDFRRAMRRLAATVTVVSSVSGGQRYGITATAVASLSMDPASLVVCVNRGASVHDPIVESGCFCVNLLCDTHASVAQAFGGKLECGERFNAGDWIDGLLGLPYLRDAQANIFCELGAATSYASHTIFVGRVAGVMVKEEVMPLLYHDGGYSSAIALQE